MKWQSHEDKHTSPSSASMKNKCSNTLTPEYPFMACTETTLPTRLWLETENLICFNGSDELLVQWRQWGSYFTTVWEFTAAYIHLNFLSKRNLLILWIPSKLTFYKFSFIPANITHSHACLWWHLFRFFLFIQVKCSCNCTGLWLNCTALLNRFLNKSSTVVTNFTNILRN